MSDFFVEPGQRFSVSYTSNGTEINFAIPDVEAQTLDVIMTINGILQTPFDHYTVHQGTLSLTLGPVTSGYIIQVKS